jgi:hypothetical protein
MVLINTVYDTYHFANAAGVIDVSSAGSKRTAEPVESLVSRAIR